MAETYLIHGLRLRSEVWLPEAGAPGGGGADVEIRRGGEADIAFEAPPGDLLLEQSFGDFGVAVVAGTEGWTMRYFGLCEFRVDGANAGVEVVRQPDVGEDVAADLLVSGLLPCLLVRRGATLLHASAVRQGGRAVAFAGGTGSGKSTRAAQLCVDGGELVSDDVLRVEQGPDGRVCHRGTARILLHSEDLALAERFERRWPRWDGRLAVAPAAVCEPILPLDEVVQLAADPGAESWQQLADRLR